MKKVFNIVLAIILLCAFVGGIIYYNHFHNNIGKDKALEIALDDAGLKKTDVYEIEIDYEGDRSFSRYEIEFKNQGYEYIYLIKANSGEIVQASKSFD